jgi:hypothetical protein
MLAVVAGVAYLTLRNDKPSALPNPHLPALPTAPANSGSSTGGLTGSTASTASTGSTGASTSPAPAPAPAAVAPTTPTTGGQPLGAGAGGCTPDPAGGACLNDGQPCPQSLVNTTATGPGGTFICTERRVVSNGGGVFSLGYAWKST